MNIPTDTIHLKDVGEDKPIFAKRDGKLVGMVIKDEEGWILRLGGDGGTTGCHNTRVRCMDRGNAYGYTFYVED